MTSSMVGSVALVVLLSCSAALAQVTAAEYKVTVRQVSTADTLKFVGAQRSRSDKAPNGKIFLVADLTIEVSDPQLRSKFEGKSILGMVMVTSNSGEVFVASGGGFDPDHTCSGDDCEVYISKATVMFYWGSQMEIKYPPAQVLFDGRLIFPITKELVGQPLKLQFQGVQISVASKAQGGSGEQAAVRGATQEYVDGINGLSFQYPTAWKEMGPAEARQLMGASTSKYLTVVIYDPGDQTQNVNVQVLPVAAKDLTDASYSDFAKGMDRQMPSTFSNFQKISSHVGRLLDMVSLEYVFEATRPDGVRLRQKQLRTGKPGREVVASFTAKADLYQKTDEACFKIIVDTLKLK